MPERPIIMSGASVNATMARLKTQTRRVMPRRTFDWWNACGLEIGDDGWPMVEDDCGNECRLPSPYEVGDTLWVRETWATRPDLGRHVEYRASHQEPADRPFAHIYDEETCWRSPLFMPRCFSRLSILITNVRAQRVQDISEEDAIAEGMLFHDGRGIGHSGFRHDPSNGFVCDTAREAYAVRWDQLNAKRGHPFSASDWVFAYAFEVKK